MSIYNLSKEELVNELQICEYYRDALYFGIKDIGMILNVNFDENLTDEELINKVSLYFNNLVNNIPIELREKLGLNLADRIKHLNEEQIKMNIITDKLQNEYKEINTSDKDKSINNPLSE